MDSDEEVAVIKALFDLTHAASNPHSLCFRNGICKTCKSVVAVTARGGMCFC